MDWIEALDVKLLSRWAHLPSIDLGDGDRFIGNSKMSHYIHKLYRPLTSLQIVDFETQVGINVPLDLKHFYEYSGEAAIFPDGIRIYGFINPYSSDNLPGYYDIIAANRKFKYYLNKKNPTLKDKLLYCIGSYTWNWLEGSYLYMNLVDGSIHQSIGLEDYNPHASWISFREFIEVEVNRLNNLYNDRGERLFRYVGEL